MRIEQLGWDHYAPTLPDTINTDNALIGRVAVQNKNSYTLYDDQGKELNAIVRGNFLKSKDPAVMPKVGDWVVFSELQSEEKVVIETVLPRISKLSRRAVMAKEEQIIATNVDVAFIVQSAGEGFNVRTLERYLVATQQSNIKPVIIINKIDAFKGYGDQLAEARGVAQTSPVIATSAVDNTGLDEITAFLQPGTTVVFIGASGVGKSSLINAVLGIDLQKVGEVRLSDEKGRHTTTRREMILSPRTGAILIDTPGMRELGAWGEERALDETFADIEALIQECKYRDCSHTNDEGCAIVAAIQDGSLSSERYASYLKLKKELSLSQSRENLKELIVQKERAKRIEKKPRKNT